MLKDQWNAFIRDDICMEPAKPGALDGLEFSVKDVFAVKGHASSAGNPDWLRTHEAGVRTAPVIEALLAGGARLRGLTHTDELMYSLSGENIHYGTPVNPKVPGRIPGGSSSGSAVAVAAGLSDFALGTDTGGSVRIPASYCGIYGFRPTHGAVSAEGVIPLAKSFDTVGWLARSSEVLLKIGRALLKHDESEESEEAVKPGKTDKPDKAGGTAQTGVPFAQVWFAEDAWRLIAPEVRAALAPAGPVMQGLLGRSRRVALAEEGLSEWAATFRTIQGYEVWQEHGEWVQQAHPRFAPDIGGRFEWAATIAREDYERSERKRREIGLYMQELVKEDGLLVIPTAPKAPDRGLRPEHTERTRTLAMELCCIAGLCGFPQMTVPFAEAGGVPVGLSFIAGRGRDLALLEWVHENLTPLLSAEEGRLEA